MPDPRKHRHVTAVDGNRLTYVCGCVNLISGPMGILVSASKCPAHLAEQKEVGDLDMDYYATMGTIENGVPMCARYIKQLQEALGPVTKARRFQPKPVALEIGCGMSMYAPMLLRAGYEYIGLDPSPWACLWTSNAFYVNTITGTLESATLTHKAYDFILATHCLEHMYDAPGAIEQCSKLLRSDGEFWIIVPDDTDPLNPDHQWFFSIESLGHCLQDAGLEVMAMETRKYIERENFIYCRAVKP